MYAGQKTSPACSTFLSRGYEDLIYTLLGYSKVDFEFPSLSDIW